MAFEDSDRRRSVLLGMLTVITVPAIYLATRSDPADTVSSTDPVTGIEIDAGRDGSLADSRPNRPPTSLFDDDPVFLDGPLVDANPGVAEVAIPARPATAPMQMSASYRSNVNGLRTCLIRALPSGRTVTVKNLDNGRSISCVTAISPATQTADVVLNTATFSLLADLTEAPITVELTQ